MTPTWSRRSRSWPLLALGLGCGPANAPALEGDALPAFGAALMHELERVPGLLSIPRLVAWTAAIVVAVALSSLVSRIWRAQRGLASETRRRLAVLHGVTQLAIGGFVVWWIFRQAFARAPMLTTVAALGSTVAAGLAIPGLFQDLAAGISLLSRRRFAEGDQVEVGGTSGTVLEIGLTRVRMLRQDGATVDLPARQFLAGSVVVERRRHNAPIRVICEDATRSVAQIDRLRRVIHQCPYRRPGTRVSIHVLEDSRLEISLQTWADRDPELVESWLRGIVEQSITRASR